MRGTASARTLVLVDSSHDMDVFCFVCIRCEQESLLSLWIEARASDDVQQSLRNFLDVHSISCGAHYVRGVLGIEGEMNTLRGELLGVTVWAR